MIERIIDSALLSAGLSTALTKRKLKKVFSVGEIYAKRNGGIIEFPRIVSVDCDGNNLRVEFVTPIGYDPDEVIQKKALFEQLFETDNLNLDRHVNNFVLTAWA